MERIAIANAGWRDRSGRAAWRRGPRGQPHFCLATEHLLLRCMRTSCELGWRGVTPMAIKRTKKADPVHVVVKVDGRRWRQVLSTPPAAASRVRVTSWPSRHTTELATRFGRRVRNL